MTDHPIIFSGSMARAYFAGLKTQTRRIITPQPHAGVRKSPFASSGLEDGHGRAIRCPYGQPGDRLWIREAWAIKDCGSRVSLDPEAWPEGWPIKRLQYIATDEAPSRDRHGNPYWWNRRPAIHMPKWACRAFPVIITIRVERVQEISGKDAIAEGIDPETHRCGCDVCYRSIEEYASLWDSLNAKRGYGWEANPWVWVIEFEGHQPQEKAS